MAATRILPVKRFANCNPTIAPACKLHYLNRPAFLQRRRKWWFYFETPQKIPPAQNQLGKKCRVGSFESESSFMRTFHSGTKKLITCQSL
jgi:hypothetical protein